MRRAQLGRILDLVLRLAEDDRDETRSLAETGQQVPVVAFQIVAVQPKETGPVKFGRYGTRLAEHGAVLVVHLEEQQVGELLYVVAIGHAVVAQDIAVVPEALNDCGGGGSSHGWRFSGIADNLPIYCRYSADKR
jgi:hypothetical protein